MTLGKRWRAALMVLATISVMSMCWVSNDLSHLEAVDTLMVTRYTVPGKVLSASFVPAHDVIAKMYNAGTRSYWPQSFPVPDTWQVKVAFAHGEEVTEVSQAFYQQLHAGSDVTVSYQKGWLTGATWVRAVVLPNGH
jgi:hypothetical protein